jgi:hypothetical protein
MKRSFLAVALGALAIPTMPAQAAKIWIDPHGCRADDCQAIHIDSQIQQEDFKKFEGIVAAEKIKKAVVYLDSMGGNMMASVRMGLKINSLGFGHLRCREHKMCEWLRDDVARRKAAIRCPNSKDRLSSTLPPRSAREHPAFSEGQHDCPGLLRQDQRGRR